MAVCVMPLVVKPVGAAGALGKAAEVLALVEAAAESPPLLLAMTLSVYCVLADNPLKVCVATSPSVVTVPLSTCTL